MGFNTFRQEQLDGPRNKSTTEPWLTVERPLPTSSGQGNGWADLWEMFIQLWVRKDGEDDNLGKGVARKSLHFAGFCCCVCFEF